MKLSQNWKLGVNGCELLRSGYLHQPLSQRKAEGTDHLLETAWTPDAWQLWQLTLCILKNPCHCKRDSHPCLMMEVHRDKEIPWDAMRCHEMPWDTMRYCYFHWCFHADCPPAKEFHTLVRVVKTRHGNTLSLSMINFREIWFWSHLITSDHIWHGMSIWSHLMRLDFVSFLTLLAEHQTVLSPPGRGRVESPSSWIGFAGESCSFSQSSCFHLLSMFFTYTYSSHILHFFYAQMLSPNSKLLYPVVWLAVRSCVVIRASIDQLLPVRCAKILEILGNV